MALNDAVEKFVEGYRFYWEWMDFVKDAEHAAYTSADFEHDIRHKDGQHFPDLTEHYTNLLRAGRDAYSKPLLAAALVYIVLHPRRAKKAMSYLSANFSEETIQKLADELFAEAR